MLLYLITDPQVLGLLAWASTFLTVVGLLAAIVQATRAKQAAEAAQRAAQITMRSVKSRESLLELTTSQAHLRSAKDSLSRGNLEAGGIYVTLLRTALIQARELMGNSDDQRQARTLVLRVTAIQEALTELAEEAAEKRNTFPWTMELTKIGGILDEITARRRYAYEADEANR